MRWWIFAGFIAIWACSGVYLASMDDCMLNTLYSGSLSMGPVTTSPGYSISYPNQLYAGLMVFLYRFFPAWSWHGICLIALNTCAVFILISTMAENVQDTLFNKIRIKGWLIFFVCLLFVLEPLVLMTYTSTAILLCAACLLPLALVPQAPRPSLPKYFTLIILLLISFSLRFQAALFTAGVFAILGLVLYYDSDNRKKGLIFLFIIVTIALIAFSINVSLRNTDQKDIEAFDQYYFSFFEGNTSKPEANKALAAKENLKLTLLRVWFFNDPQVFTTNYLQSVTYDSPYTRANMLNWKNKFSAIGSSAFAYQDKQYLFYTNWGIHAIFALFFNLLLFLRTLVVPDSNRVKIKAFIFNAGFWFILVGVYLVAGMQHRLFVPIIAMYSLMNFLWVLDLIQKSGTDLQIARFQKIGLYLFIFLGILKVVFIEISALQKNDELRRKEVFVQEMNAQNGKQFIFDTYTLCLLGNNSIRRQVLNKHNQYATTGDYYQRFFKEFRGYWISQCGSSDYLSILKYLSQHKQNTLFVSEPRRIGLTTTYVDQFYHYSVPFTKTLSSSALDSIRYSILPASPGLGYYKIDP